MPLKTTQFQDILSRDIILHKMIHYVTQHFQPSDPSKRAQIEDCLTRNQRLGIFDQVTLLMDSETMSSDPDSSRRVRLGRRANFSDFLEIVSAPENAEDHIVFSNSDILMSEDILQVTERLSSHSSVIALTRRELSGELPPILPGRSQDTWIMKGHAISSLLRDTVGISLGIAGCENIFAAQLIANGYNLWNPCLDVVTTHNDPSPNFNYEDCRRYFGFYAFPTPCRVKDVEASLPNYEFAFLSMS